MRQTRKITVTASLELDQLERLTALARKEGISRSTIVRQAIERELHRYEGVGELGKVANSGTGQQGRPGTDLLQ